MTNLTAQQMGREIDEQICASRGNAVKYQDWGFISREKMIELHGRVVGQAQAAA